MQFRKYSLEQLIDAVKVSTSIRECLIKLDVAPRGGNYDVFRKAVSKYNIDTSHFTGQSGSGVKNKGKRRKIPINELLVKDSNYGSNKLRKRLLEEGIFPHKCSECLLSVWNNLPIPLELDHINGDNSDNQINNLRILCPNCHAQTPTYRGRNKKKKGY